jgi:hypothetical protein
MTPAQFIAEFGSMRVDQVKQYNYVRIYASGLTIDEARMLKYAYPASYIRSYGAKRDPDRCWRWTSGSLRGLDQVIRDLRLARLLDYNFIECIWMYVWAKARHRAEIARRLRKMIGDGPVELKRLKLAST